MEYSLECEWWKFPTTPTKIFPRFRMILNLWINKLRILKPDTIATFYQKHIVAKIQMETLKKFSPKILIPFSIKPEK